MDDRKNSPNHSSFSINIRGELFDLSVPRVMGVLNLTPDSFYEGSRVQTIDRIILKASELTNEGADILDIGGYSSRPGAVDISVNDEITRVIEPIRELRKAFPKIVLSIDTFRKEVAERALDEGVDIINDISGGHLDERLLEFVARSKVPFIAMHMRGNPQTMKEHTDYEDILFEMTQYFGRIIEKFHSLGGKDLILDPGFGFAKNIEQNFYLLNRLEHFHHLDKPLLVGLSRKSMIYKTLECTPEEALNGTTVLNTLALYKGVNIVRVHDVKPVREVIKLIGKIR